MTPSISPLIESPTNGDEEMIAAAILELAKEMGRIADAMEAGAYVPPVIDPPVEDPDPIIYVEPPVVDPPVVDPNPIRYVELETRASLGYNTKNHSTPVQRTGGYDEAKKISLILPPGTKVAIRRSPRIIYKTSQWTEGDPYQEAEFHKNWVHLIPQQLPNPNGKHAMQFPADYNPPGSPWQGGLINMEYIKE